MGPQFVDFNADGHADIVTATFDGSPWLSLGSKEGFAQPSRILDKDGKRLILNNYWDYDAKKWANSDRAGVTSEEAHCISAAAIDWDADGDHDLLLGSYDGHMWLQMNEGNSKEPKFTGKNVPLMVGDKPFHAGDKMTAPVLVDWDKDGLLDLVVGTFGDSYGGRKGGVVKWFRNVGKKGAPAFEAAKSLIEMSRFGGAEPTRPDAGLYVAVADYDADGDLDLVVGGYSMWEAAGEDNKGSPMPKNRKPFVWVYLQKNEKKEAKPDDGEKS